MKGYISVTEAANLWGISERRIQVLCKEGRVGGVIRFGKSWAIPSDTQKPADARIKTGKYIGMPRVNKKNMIKD